MPQSPHSAVADRRWTTNTQQSPHAGESHLKYTQRNITANIFLNGVTFDIMCNLSAINS